MQNEPRTAKTKALRQIDTAQQQEKEDERELIAEERKKYVQQREHLVGQVLESRKRQTENAEEQHQKLQQIFDELHEQYKECEQLRTKIVPDEAIKTKKCRPCAPRGFPASRAHSLRPGRWGSQEG